MGVVYGCCWVVGRWAVGLLCDVLVVLPPRKSRACAHLLTDCACCVRVRVYVLYRLQCCDATLATVCSYLLEELLTHTSTHVVCLVRSSPDTSPVDRLKLSRLGAQLRWSDVGDTSAEHHPGIDFDLLGGDRCMDGRVTVVRGDLSLPRLGVSMSMWEQLSRQVDAIFHNGA